MPLSSMSCRWEARLAHQNESRLDALVLTEVVECRGHGVGFHEEVQNGVGKGEKAASRYFLKRLRNLVVNVTYWSLDARGPRSNLP